MTRQELYDEIEETLGLVPTVLKELPDSTLELEWQLYKKVQFEEGPVPNKYRELIGVTLPAVVFSDVKPAS